MKTFDAYVEMADAALALRFPEREEEAHVQGEIAPLLYRAMRYSLLSGGKRVRAALMLAAADMLGECESALKFAMAVEMIHASSLIHDDMPCMDNDVLRRGQPTNHIVFGEGQALLAGDGLLNMAYEIMLEAEGARAHAAVREIARGAGVRGMMAGQCADLQSEGVRSTGREEMLTYIQANKTAAMFAYPLRAVAVLTGADEAVQEDLFLYGLKLGLLFQTTDDILDIEGDETLGKTLRKDDLTGKLTAVSLYGLGGAKAYAEALAGELKDIAGRLPGGKAFFSGFVDQMANRRK